jgi:tetratricopeptide (TPR) repeat protein
MAIPTEVISLVSGAVSGGGVSYLIHYQDVRGQRVQQTREVLLALIDLRGQIMDSEGMPQERSEVLVQKRVTLLAVASSSARRAGRSLTAHDWIALGYECQNNCDYDDAYAHFERAVRRAKKEDMLTRVFALRFLAEVCCAPGPHHDYTRGAGLYLEAVNLTRGNENPFLRYHTGLTLGNWTSWAYRYEQPDRHELFEQAKQQYRDAIEGYPLAAKALGDLEENERQGFRRRNTLPPPIPASAPVPPGL